MKKQLGKFVAITLIGTTTYANAGGIPVIDGASIAQQIIDYANQGLQYAQLLDQYNQQLTDYSLELQNLAALPGNVRSQVKQRFDLQSVSNLTDYGVSYSGTSIMLDPDVSTFYNNAETLLKNINGDVPQTMASLNATLANLGLATNNTNATWQNTYESRMKYEGLLDDYRANALMRKNSADRANEAKNITTQMSTLPSNNTVGAIQLLAAQNSLSYAQSEELLKQQAIANRLAQTEQLAILSNESELRQAKLSTLQKYNAINAYPTAPF